MQIYKKSGYWFSWIKSNINNNVNFRIKTQLHLVSNNKKIDYGLMWGKNAKNNYCFGIYPNGHFIYGKYVNSKWHTIHYQKSNIIKPKDNTLEVLKIGKLIYFLINDKIVYKTNFEHFTGSNIGFYTYSPGVIKSDFIVYSELY